MGHRVVGVNALQRQHCRGKLQSLLVVMRVEKVVEQFGFWVPEWVKRWQDVLQSVGERKTGTSAVGK